jgi:hypothetical protein
VLRGMHFTAHPSTRLRLFLSFVWALPPSRHMRFDAWLRMRGLASSAFAGVWTSCGVSTWLITLEYVI